MVTGLSTSLDSFYSDLSEVVDMTVDINSSTSCLQLPTYPFKMWGASGGVINGFPMVCGGYKDSGFPKVESSCYSHDKELNIWKQHATMNQARYLHASVVIDNSLWVTGGGYQAGNGLDTFKSTEFVHGNGTVTMGPDLPTPRYGHCIVTLHDGKVMIIGGDPTYQDVLVFDQSNNGFTTGPSTLEQRYIFACTIFNSPLHGNRPIVLAAGHSGSSVDQTAEIYDYTITNEWEKSMYLFIKQEFLFLQCTAMAPFTNYFLKFVIC